MRTYTRSDFDHSPLVVFYEVTQACDLACLHCRACAQPRRAPGELTPRQSLALIAQLALFPKPPMLVITGGDPLKRDDVFALVAHGVHLGLEVAMTPSATPLVTVDALDRLKRAGLARLAVSLDGADAQTHDAFRGTPGSFSRTLWILEHARALGLPLQVNTTLTRRNADQVDRIAELLAEQGIVLWSVFFLVPVGRGALEPRLTSAQLEQVFERLWAQARLRPYAIKTTEGHHYRRFVLQQRGRLEGARLGGRQRAPLGINDGKGVVFVGHAGVIQPSGFLPADCGRFPDASVIDTYQHHPLFRLLRDGDQLNGKCGRCEFRHLCGGSRARAFAVSGDPMGEEPDCAYEPEPHATRALTLCRSFEQHAS